MKIDIGGHICFSIAFGPPLLLTQGPQATRLEPYVVDDVCAI